MVGVGGCGKEGALFGWAVGPSEKWVRQGKTRLGGLGMRSSDDPESPGACYIRLLVGCWGFLGEKT